MGRKTSKQIQFAAIPFSVGTDGRTRVMLLTSRQTKRWVIPKGWPMIGHKPREVAEQEAYEEAGVVGRIIGKRPVGVYHYSKGLPSREHILCQVSVYLLLVEAVMDDWPEKDERERAWFETAKAASLVNEGGLSEILLTAVP
jgi:8-oxo-dGTP pyrophosphatase MutT (NUDIX family)